MTTELEKQFFDTFGIEPIANKYECRCGTSSTKHTIKTCKSPICDKTYCDQKQTGVFYPMIKNRHYLELICILNDYTGINVRAIKIEELKDELLKHCIELIEYELYNVDDIDNFKHQVQAIFEGER